MESIATMMAAAMHDSRQGIELEVGGDDDDNPDVTLHPVSKGRTGVGVVESRGHPGVRERVNAREGRTVGETAVRQSRLVVARVALEDVAVDRVRAHGVERGVKAADGSLRLQTAAVGHGVEAILIVVHVREGISGIT